MALVLLLRILELVILLHDVRFELLSVRLGPFELMGNWLKVGADLDHLLDFTSDLFNNAVILWFLLKLQSQNFLKHVSQ